MSALRPDEARIFHHDTSAKGTRITRPEEREPLLLPRLPPELRHSAKHQPPQTLFSRPHLRPFLTTLLHLLVFHLIQLIFSIYIHTRRTLSLLTTTTYSILYYHHRSPELIQRDVRNLSRVPNHLSIIVDLASADINDPHEALDRLVSEVAECAAWCACAGIGMLSVYERTGALKTNITTLNRTLRETLHAYFPPSSEPVVRVRAPLSMGDSRSPSPNTQVNGDASDRRKGELDLLLLSASDGRATLVDLTKTLAEMAQKRKLAPSDITTGLIDAEVSESSCGEPDLLVVMVPSDTTSPFGLRRRKRRRVSSVRQPLVNGDVAAAQTEIVQEDVRVSGGGGEICLRGYPPWQARLTEIFHVRDSRGFDYQTFLRALHRFAKAEMRFGR